MLNLTKALHQRYGDHKPSSIEEIILDNITIKELTIKDKEELEKYNNLKLLCFNLCKLNSLKNLPHCPQLTRIELSDNVLSGSELKHLLIYPQLKTIQFCNNKVNSISELEPLKELKHLDNLDLTENPIVNSEDYRKKVFEMLPSLVYLDMEDKDGQMFYEEDENDNEEEEEEEGEIDFIEDDEEEDEEYDDDEEEDNGQGKEDDKEKDEDEGYVPGKKKKIE